MEIGWERIGRSKTFKVHQIHVQSISIPSQKRKSKKLVSTAANMCVFAYRGFLGTKDQTIHTIIIIPKSLQKKKEMTVSQKIVDGGD